LSIGEVGNGGEVGRGGGGEERGGGVTVDEFEDPAAGDVLDEEGEFGECESQQMVELVDDAGALADGGLESSGDLSEQSHLVGHGRRVGGPFAEGVACGGAGLDGIGLLGAEQGGAVVFVALRIAAGDGEAGEPEGVGPRSGRGAERMQEVEEVVGVLAGGVEADDEVDGAEALGDAFEPSAEFAVAVAGLGEEEFGGGRLQIGAEEGGVVAVACGVDADADARGRLVGAGRRWRSGGVLW